MPIKLREFYWRELLKAKEEENAAMQNVNKSVNASKTRRR
jgi:hypothetical protein